MSVHPHRPAGGRGARRGRLRGTEGSPTHGDGAHRRLKDHYRPMTAMRVHSIHRLIGIPPCALYVPEFLRDRLRASIQFPVMPKRAQYARFSGESGHCVWTSTSTYIYIMHRTCTDHVGILQDSRMHSSESSQRRSSHIGRGAPLPRSWWGVGAMDFSAERSGTGRDTIVNPIRSSLQEGELAEPRARSTRVASATSEGGDSAAAAGGALCVQRVVHGGVGAGDAQGDVAARVTLEQLLPNNGVVRTARVLALSWEPGGKANACGLLVLLMNVGWLAVGCMALSVAVRVTSNWQGDENWVSGDADDPLLLRPTFRAEAAGTALTRFYFILVLFALPTMLRLHATRAFGPRRSYRDLSRATAKDGGEDGSESPLVRDVRAAIRRTGPVFYLPMMFGLLVTVGPAASVLRGVATLNTRTGVDENATEIGTVDPPDKSVIMPVLVLSCVWVVVVCPLTTVAMQLQIVAHLHREQLRSLVDDIVSQRLGDAAAALREFRSFKKELDASSKYWQHVWILLLGTCALGLLTLYGSLKAIQRNAELAEAEEAAGLHVSTDRKFSATVDKIAVSGLPVNLFGVVLLFCLLSVARVNSAIAQLPEQLCEVSAFGEDRDGTQQRHVLINELQWTNAAWHIVGWEVSDGKLVAAAISVVVPIALSLRDSLTEAGTSEAVG